MHGNYCLLWRMKENHRKNGLKWSTIAQNVENDSDHQQLYGLHSQYHTGKFSHYCGQCRKGFTRKSHYDEHMRKHEGRGYACEYCPKLFQTAKGLRNHLSEHTGKFRFTCEICRNTVQCPRPVSQTPRIPSQSVKQANTLEMIQPICFQWLSSFSFNCHHWQYCDILSFICLNSSNVLLVLCDKLQFRMWNLNKHVQWGKCLWNPCRGHSSDR